MRLRSRVSAIVFHENRHRRAKGHDLRRERCRLDRPWWNGRERQPNRNGKLQRRGLIGDNRIGGDDHVDTSLNIRFSFAGPSCPFLVFEWENDDASPFTVTCLVTCLAIFLRNAT